MPVHRVLLHGGSLTFGFLVKGCESTNRGGPPVAGMFGTQTVRKLVTLAAVRHMYGSPPFIGGSYLLSFLCLWCVCVCLLQYNCSNPAAIHAMGRVCYRAARAAVVQSIFVV